MACKNQLPKNIRINIMPSKALSKFLKSPCHLSLSTRINYARSRIHKLTKTKGHSEAVFFLWTFVHRLVFNGVECFGSLLCFRFHVKPVQWLYSSITYWTCLSSPSTRTVIMEFAFPIAKYQAVKIFFCFFLHLCKIFTFGRYNKLNKTVCSEQSRP